MMCFEIGMHTIYSNFSSNSNETKCKEYTRFTACKGECYDFEVFNFPLLNDICIQIQSMLNLQNTEIKTNVFNFS